MTIEIAEAGCAACGVRVCLSAVRLLFPPLWGGGGVGLCSCWVDLRRGAGRVVVVLVLVGSLLVSVPQAGAAHTLATPSNLSAASPGDTTVSSPNARLSWDAVTGANRYQVQYGLSPSGTLSTQTATTNFLDLTGLTEGQTYRFRVQATAVPSTHSGSALSAYATFTARAPLTAPTGLSVTADDATLSLSWTASTSSGVAGYDVHYTSADAAGVADTDAASGSDASAGWVAVTRTGTTASQTISSLSNGTPYRVRIRATSTNSFSAWVQGSGTPLKGLVSLTGPATVAEGETARFTVMISSEVASTDDWTVGLRTVLGSAESADIDDQVGTGNFTSALGVMTQTRDHATIHDTDQDDDTFTVSIVSPPTGHGIGSPSSVTVTIVDDDKPSLSLSVSPNPVSEGDPVTVTAQLSHATVNALTIPVRLTAGTAESGDYGTLTSISIAAGATSGSATVTTVEDADSDEETFTVSLGEGLPATVTAGSPTSVLVTITDAIAVSLGPAVVDVPESGIVDGLRVDSRGNRVDSNGDRVVYNQARLDLVLSAVPPDVQSLAFAVITKRVTSEQDDHDEPQFVTYRSQHGRNSPVFIDTYGDNGDADEVFTVELDGSKLPDGYELGDQTKVTVTIREKPKVSISVSEDRVLAGHPVTVTATRPVAAAYNLPVWVKVTPGSAGTSDYRARWRSPGIVQVDIAPGATSGTAEVFAIGDKDMCAETFNVKLYDRDWYRRGDPTTAEVTIIGINPDADECQPEPEPDPEEETPTDTRTIVGVQQPVVTAQPDTDPDPDPDVSEDPDPDPEPDAGDGDGSGEVPRQPCQPSGQPAGFTDVTPGDTHSDCIEAIYAAGITKGCGTNPLRYCGDDSITRAEMASFLARALKLQPSDQPAGFTDVDPAGTHSTNIEAIYAAGITKGCGTSPLRYCGDDSITRAEMASFLARALKLPTPAQPAGFLNLDPDSIHSSAIEAIYAAGITKGCNTSPLRYCGDDPVTRAEIASFIARAFKL